MLGTFSLSFIKAFCQVRVQGQDLNARVSLSRGVSELPLIEEDQKRPNSMKD